MQTILSDAQIERIQAMFSDADSLIICAGAGMGVDSGLPDFRGNEGMWNTYPALGKQNIDFTEIANPMAFSNDPRLAWGFYGHRLALYRQTKPHEGFVRLQQLSLRLNLPYFVFTSNVDGQFQKAGFDPHLIYECHGSIHHLQCLSSCRSKVWKTKNLKPEIDPVECQWLESLPLCPYCGELARPNILMFNDMDWVPSRYSQQKMRLDSWLKKHKRPLVIELGAGTAIPSVRRFGENFATALVRINPRENDVPKWGVAIPTGAKEGVELLCQILLG